MKDLKVEGKVLAQYERLTKKHKLYDWAKYKVVTAKDGKARYAATLNEVAWVVADVETSAERTAMYEKQERIHTKAVNRLLKKVR